jgi:predicted XRE-type DNA-binding protein
MSASDLVLHRGLDKGKCRSCKADVAARQRICFKCRVWSFVAAGGDECWPWVGRLNEHGYGVVDAPGHNGRPLLAHRAVWSTRIGDIPDGLCVLHRCDNPPCCNPSHLFIGTQADNIADMNAKGRRRTRGLPGSANHNAVLSEAAVAEIRSLYATRKFTQQNLADQFGVTRALISDVTLAKIWRHVPGDAAPLRFMSCRPVVIDGRSLSRREASSVLGVSERTVSRMVRRGLIKEAP